MRVVHDSVHGTYQLHDLLWIIIDSPEFQRLRKIKQTGNTYRVYPGAVHTRFEHSLGTAHLCSSLCNKLRNDDGYITKKDIMCLQIAALCHDIGHCAFSHLFDKIVDKISKDKEFCHEAQSYYILKRIFNRNKPKFFEYGIGIQEIHLIGMLILGSKNKTPTKLIDELGWSNTNKKFLFEIISNESTGIDIDKFDYIKRDCHHIGITCGFDSQRLMEFAYLKKDEKGDILLEYHRKGKEIIAEMWRARTDLHRRAYRHRVVQIIDEMVAKVFLLISNDFPVISITGKKSKIIDASNDLDCYLALTDVTLDKIHDFCLQHQVPNIRHASRIINAIESRNLWSAIANVVLKEPIIFEHEKGLIVSEYFIDSKFIYYFIISDSYTGKIEDSLSNIKRQCDSDLMEYKYSSSDSD